MCGLSVLYRGEPWCSPKISGPIHASSPTDDQSKDLFSISPGTPAEVAKLGR